MGLIKDILVEAAKDVIRDTAVDAAVSASDKIDKGAKAVGKGIGHVFGDKKTRHYKKELKYLSENPDNTYLYIQKITKGKQKSYEVYAIDEALKYRASGNWNETKIDLKLFNPDGMQIASVKKSFSLLHALSFHEGRPSSYKIEIVGRNPIALETKFSMVHKNFEIDPYGYRVQGSLIKWDFRVMNGDMSLLHVTKRTGYDVPTYIMDFHDKDYEIIWLMIVLTLICRDE